MQTAHLDPFGEALPCGAPRTQDVWCARARRPRNAHKDTYKDTYKGSARETLGGGGAEQSARAAGARGAHVCWVASACVPTVCRLCCVHVHICTQSAFCSKRTHSVAREHIR